MKKKDKKKVEKKYKNWRLPSETITSYFRNIKYHIIYSYDQEFKKIRRIKIISSNKIGSDSMDWSEDISNMLTSRISRTTNLKATLIDLFQETPKRRKNEPTTLVGFVVSELLKKYGYWQEMVKNDNNKTI
jgi:hypothetical protein